ncbi:hypothetical protein [Nonomuraea dietziae]|uniref:hypothetical protein n=1 Tax=Nonomuraea dietziae TaxID=65515 RepID=UPI003403DC59
MAEAHGAGDRIDVSQAQMADLPVGEDAQQSLVWVDDRVDGSPLEEASLLVEGNASMSCTSTALIRYDRA